MTNKIYTNKIKKFLLTWSVFYRAIFRFSFQRLEFKTFFIFSTNSTNSVKDLTTLLTEFYHLWPLSQWISSFVSLILLYWITGYYYNKWLSNKGGWLNWKMRIWLIVSDLTINLILGLYYLNHRETVMGVIMLKCPIAISPLIFVLELTCVYIYYRFGKKSSSKIK